MGLLRKHYERGNLNNISCSTLPDGQVEVTFRDMSTAPYVKVVGRDPVAAMVKALDASAPGRRIINPISAKPSAKPKRRVSEDDFL